MTLPPNTPAPIDPDIPLESDLRLVEPLNGQTGYKVSKDTLNWILQAGTVARTGKKAGQVIWDNIGYYGTVASLIRGYHSRIALASESPLPESLNEATREAGKLLERIKRGLLVEVQA